MKPITDFENYSISNDGVVISNKTGKEIKHIRVGKVHTVGLYGKCGWKRLTVARLVLEHYEKPAPSPKAQAAYKDHNPDNLRIENLYWRTGKKETLRLFLAACL